MSGFLSSPPAGSLGSQIETGVWEDRRRAFRMLLQRPLLVADGPHAQAFALVRRHADWLRDWLARHTHWRLHVDNELARLRKYPADLADATRPAADPRSGVSFSRRRYVMFCLALATLERAERQTVLGDVADGIRGLAAADPAITEAGLHIDLTQRDQRRDLVQMIRLLIDLGVLVRVDGDEEQFVMDKAEVLYAIHRVALAALLNIHRGPSTVDDNDRLAARLDALVSEPAPDGDDARNRIIRTRLVTRLLDDPVLYYADLTDAERAYLATQRPHLIREIEAATGLVAEVRHEGIAMVDPKGDATDLGMPEEGTNGHLTLLLAEWLANRAKGVPREQPVIVGLAALRERTAELIVQYGKEWRQAAREPGAEAALTEQTVDRLEALRLIRRVEDGVAVRPAIARYALDAPRVTGDGDPEQAALWKAPQ